MSDHKFKRGDRVETKNASGKWRRGKIVEIRVKRPRPFLLRMDDLAWYPWKRASDLRLIEEKPNPWHYDPGDLPPVCLKVRIRYNGRMLIGSIDKSGRWWYGDSFRGTMLLLPPDSPPDGWCEQQKWIEPPEPEYEFWLRMGPGRWEVSDDESDYVDFSFQSEIGRIWARTGEEAERRYQEARTYIEITLGKGEEEE